MAASLTTVRLQDSTSAALPFAVLDESGTGAGPFHFVGIIADAAGTAISATNPLRIAGTPITLTDRSGTITTGGTAQQAAAANSSRKFLVVHNPDTATDLWFSTTGTAATTAGGGSFRLAPGGGVVFDVEVPNGAVSVLSATTGKGFVVKEG